MPHFGEGLSRITSAEMYLSRDTRDKRSLGHQGKNGKALIRRKISHCHLGFAAATLLPEDNKVTYFRFSGREYVTPGSCLLLAALRYIGSSHVITIRQELGEYCSHGQYF